MTRLCASERLVLLFCVLLVAVPASAQDLQAAATNQASGSQGQQGPLVLERIHNGWVITPDVQVTRFDNSTRTLVGAYGGWLLEQTLLLGAGGYWMVDGSHDQGMGYGGFVIGWTMPATARIRLGVRGLVGGGQATIGQDVTMTLPPFDSDHPHGGMGPWWDGGAGITPTTPFTEHARFHEGFFIAEPQAQAVFRVVPWLAIDVGGGYRAVAGAHGLDKQIRGAVGSLGVRFGV